MNGKTEMPTSENTSRAVLIAEVESRLQFNVFVSIFFCTLLYSFFRSIGKDDVMANTVLRDWAAVPAFYLLTYVFCECGRSLIPKGWLKRIDVLLLIGTALFVLPMILMAAVEAKWLRIEVLLGLFSLWGIAILASLLNIPVVIGIGAGVYARWREQRPAEQAAVGRAFRSLWSWCRTKMEGGMSQRIFLLIAGVVFGLVALAHVLRIVFGWSVVIQDFPVPMWASWIAVIVMGYLAYEGFRLARTEK